MKTLNYACLQTSRASYDARPALLGKLPPGDVNELNSSMSMGMEAAALSCTRQDTQAHLLHSIAMLGCSMLRVRTYAPQVETS